MAKSTIKTLRVGSNQVSQWRAFSKSCPSSKLYFRKCNSSKELIRPSGSIMASITSEAYEAKNQKYFDVFPLATKIISFLDDNHFLTTAVSHAFLVSLVTVQDSITALPDYVGARDSCPKPSLKMYTVMSSCVCQKSTSGTNYYESSRAFTTTASCRYPQQLSSSRSFPRRGNFLLFRIMALVGKALHSIRIHDSDKKNSRRSNSRLNAKKISFFLPSQGTYKEENHVFLKTHLHSYWYKMQIVLLLSKALGNIILTLSKAKRRLLPKNAQSDKVKRLHSVWNYP